MGTDAVKDTEAVALESEPAQEMDIVLDPAPNTASSLDPAEETLPVVSPLKVHAVALVELQVSVIFSSVSALVWLSASVAVGFSTAVTLASAVAVKLPEEQVTV